MVIKLLNQTIFYKFLYQIYFLNKKKKIVLLIKIM